MAIDILTQHTIKMQVAYLMARYGDEPENLMNTIEVLIMDWFKKGIIMQSDNYLPNSKVPTQIYCPMCDEKTVVYHFSWSALKCKQCRKDIPKNAWNFLESDNEQ